ncbi:dynamin family protein [Protofrankia symbiont of Coriaria ruscifolia]|uniref:dynamin family protein n=1 Tax=Protofrankia symbiont of Coriaria ruscifolia TaxID=1306542 RepID=UPI0013EF9FA7|nr:dynamin family protein [Protofrankia symbiont of Coriaria ruscifolia]
MTGVDETRDDLAHLLGRCETWLETLGNQDDAPQDVNELAADVARVRSLRTRALSTLLNVGMLGRQSAGKSFLISGLQGRLEYWLVDDDDDEGEYTGILPSSANPTTACPSTVVPVGDDPSVNASGRGLLRVKFDDSDWVEIGTDLPPAVAASYGAADGKVTDRRREHINRRVLEIEVLISDALLPVKLFDLPGSESPDGDHDLIMRGAWAEADCFIYVTQATSALTVNELDLIRDLYAHHLQTGKRVLWVLTGIDRATQREHGQAAWRNVQATNNDYLRTHFADAGGGLAAFVSEGFLPVSAAWEAKAAAEEANGNATRNLRQRSGMDTLRDRLHRLVESGAGDRHLVQVADEARRLIRRRHRPIRDIVDAHQVSVDELASQQAAVAERLERAASSAEGMRAELADELERAIRVGQRPFADLPQELHCGLDQLIDEGKLDAEHVHEIDVRQVQIYTQWMVGPDGPATVWQRQLEQLDAKGRTLLRLALGDDATGSQLVSPEPLDSRLPPPPADARGVMSVYSLVQIAAGTVGVAGPFVGGAAALMTSLSLASIALPVGAAVAAAIGIAKITEVLKERESVIKKARSERKRMIDEQAKQAREDFVDAARSQGQMLIDAVEEHLEQHRARLHATLAQIMDRIDAEDTVASRELVARLAPVEQTGREIVAELRDLADRP